MRKISDTLLSEFIRATDDRNREKRDYTVYGTISTADRTGAYVKLDGANTSTRFESGVSASYGDRVMVSIKNRKGSVIANLTKKTVNLGTALKSQSSGGSMSGAGGVSGAGIEEQGDVYILDPSKDYAIVIEDTLFNKATYIDADKIYVYGSSGGYAVLTDSGVSTSSDRNRKDQIEDIDPDLALRLRPVSFKYRNEYGMQNHYGFVAQEVQDVIPRAVTKSPDGSLGLIYSELIAPTLALAKENARKVKELEGEIEELKEEVRRLVEAQHNSVSTEE